MTLLSVGFVFTLSAGSSLSAEPLAPKLSISKSTPKKDLPFWKQKESVIRKMRDERAIVVSVNQETISKNPKKVRFTMQGAGWVRRPKETCFRLAQEYPRLKEVSDHFREVNYSRAKNELFVITEALGYQARMLMKVQPVSEDWRSEIQWEVIWGHFKGMKGVIGFEDASRGQAEVSLTSVYEAEELPLPKILMGFALEVITQKVAEKMRTFLEENSPQPAALNPSVDFNSPDVSLLETKSSAHL